MELLGRATTRPQSGRFRENGVACQFRSKVSVVNWVARSRLARMKRGSPAKQWKAYSVGVIKVESISRRSQRMRGLMFL